MKKCLVVYNPNSGKYNKKETLPNIKKILEEYNYEVDIKETGSKGDATSIVAKYPSCDLLISIGGDGTFNEVTHHRGIEINIMPFTFRNNK